MERVRTAQRLILFRPSHKAPLFDFLSHKGRIEQVTMNGREPPLQFTQTPEGGRDRGDIIIFLFSSHSLTGRKLDTFWRLSFDPPPLRQTEREGRMRQTIDHFSKLRIFHKRIRAACLGLGWHGRKFERETRGSLKLCQPRQRLPGRESVWPTEVSRTPRRQAPKWHLLLRCSDGRTALI